MCVVAAPYARGARLLFDRLAIEKVLVASQIGSCLRRLSLVWERVVYVAKMAYA